MNDSIKQTMAKAEKLAIKIKKKIKRNDLDYSVQVSMSTSDPGQLYYALQITPVAEGIKPMTFIDKSPTAFIEKIEARLEDIDAEKIEIAYHESQIAHAKRTIEYHEESIKELTEISEAIAKDESDGKEASSEQDAR